MTGGGGSGGTASVPSLAPTHPGIGHDATSEPLAQATHESAERRKLRVRR